MLWQITKNGIALQISSDVNENVKPDTALNILEYRFSLTHIFLYKDIAIDDILSYIKKYRSNKTRILVHFTQCNLKDNLI